MNTILQTLQLHWLYWSDVMFERRRRAKKKRIALYLARWLWWAAAIGTLSMRVSNADVCDISSGATTSDIWSNEGAAPAEDYGGLIWVIEGNDSYARVAPSSVTGASNANDENPLAFFINTSHDGSPITGDGVRVDYHSTLSNVQVDGSSVNSEWFFPASSNSDALSSQLTFDYKGYHVTITLTKAANSHDLTVSAPTCTTTNTAPTVTTPTISGTAKIGSTLTASASGSDTDAGDTVTLAYLWFRGDASSCDENDASIASATSNAYTPVSADIGYKLCVQATPNDGTVDGTPQTSAATAVVENYGSITVSIDGSVSETGSTTTGTVTVPENVESNLTVTLSSDAEDEAIVGSSVTISSGSNSAQFTITGVNDDDIDGNQTATITASATDYTNGTGNVTVIDDDRTTVNLTTSNVNITEGGSTTFTVVLSRMPEGQEGFELLDASPLNLLDLLFPKAYADSIEAGATVTVTLVASEQLSLDKETLTFSSINWDTPQTVTVSTTDNSNVDGDRSGTITISSTSEDDENYDGAVVVIDGSDGNTMTINIADNDIAASDTSSGGSAPPPPDYYQLSVAGSQAHIKSSPSGIDCEYGQGTCSKIFDRGETVKLELVSIKTKAGFSQDDYNIQWFGNDSGCAKQEVRMYDSVSCAVRVQGKQDVDYSGDAGNTDETVTNQLEMLNFSGHGMLRGGAEDVFLGFILEGDGTADVTLHADIIDTGVIPKFDLNQVLVNEAGQFYGNLLDQQQQPQSFTFDKTVEAGAYTIQLSSNGVKGRGMAGITLKNSSLNLTNLSVRGYLQQPLVFNFIVNGEGTQQAKISSLILDGEVQTQMTLINLATGQAISGDAGLANGTTVDIAAGSYAIVLNVTSGQGIGMIGVDLLQ